MSGDEDAKKRRLQAMVAARHAILALRQLHNVPDGATAHGVEITVGCVTDDLGRMADAIKAHFLADSSTPSPVVSVSDGADGARPRTPSTGPGAPNEKEKR